MAAGAASYATQAQSYAAAAEVSKDAAAVSESNAAASAAEAQAAVRNIALLPGFYNLKANSTSNNVAVTADYAVLRNSSGTTKTLINIDIDLDVTIGTTLLGDESTVTANDTWYKIWLIYNPTTAVKQLILSAESATVPTLPSGYTHYVFVMCVRATSGSLYYLQKRDKKVTYIVDGTVLAGLRAIASGVLGTWSSAAPTWASVSTLDFIPITASLICLIMHNKYKGNTTSAMCLASNSNYGGYANAAGNTPLVFVNDAFTDSWAGTLKLESTNIYVVSAASGGAFFCSGWEDNL
jgi:hypothetical protein